MEDNGRSMGIDTVRQLRPAAQGTAEITKATREDVLAPSGADLRKANLRGIVIEDASKAHEDELGSYPWIVKILRTEEAANPMTERKL